MQTSKDYNHNNMDEKVYFLAKEINDELNKNEKVQLLNKLDKKLNESYDVYLLSEKKDKALEKYASIKDALGEDHIDTINARKELQAAKEELNNHPLVKEYLKVYSEIRDLYLQINNILLDDYKGGNC